MAESSTPEFAEWQAQALRETKGRADGGEVGRLIREQLGA